MKEIRPLGDSYGKQKSPRISKDRVQMAGYRPRRNTLSPLDALEIQRQMEGDGRRNSGESGKRGDGIGEGSTPSEILLRYEPYFHYRSFS